MCCSSSSPNGWSAACASGDTVARLGGDEFGILAGGDLDARRSRDRRLEDPAGARAPVPVNGHEIEVRASIGITLAPRHGDNIDDLLRRADLAMYDAKRTGGGYALFAAEQEETPARRLALLGGSPPLHRARRAGAALPAQDRPRHRRDIGVEALIRWNHPSGRLFMPDEFMPEVERSELMIPITEWVINEALRQLRIWRDEGYDLTMAVNSALAASPRTPTLFETRRCPHDAEWGIPPEKLTFELTESALIDTTVPGMLERLQNMDERLSIDDFGTGYSSLVYLQRLPVVEIKADRSFVTTMCTVKDDAVIVRSIIDLAHNLGAKVVAEGVEDEATIDLLNEYGCDAAQGYYFSRPMPGDEMVHWLETSSYGLPRVWHRWGRGPLALVASHDYCRAYRGPGRGAVRG